MSASGASGRGVERASQAPTSTRTRRSRPGRHRPSGGRPSSCRRRPHRRGRRGAHGPSLPRAATPRAGRTALPVLRVPWTQR
jgi:hypothetical protein